MVMRSYFIAQKSLPHEAEKRQENLKKCKRKDIEEKHQRQHRRRTTGKKKNKENHHRVKEQTRERTEEEQPVKRKQNEELSFGPEKSLLCVRVYVGMPMPKSTSVYLTC